MKKILLNKQTRIIVDILLVVVFFIFIIDTKQNGLIEDHWRSPHCIVGIIWFFLILVHIWQNWKMIKAFTKKKVITKNKITAITIFTFILLSFSIGSFLLGINLSHFHHVIGGMFAISVLIHTIQKFKRFITLFKR